MESQTQSGTDSSSSQSSAPSNTPASSPASTPSSGQSSTPMQSSGPTGVDRLKQASATQSQQSSAPEAAQLNEVAAGWSPNYKFSVMKQEHEIPEMYRQLIKDEATEKEIKDLFEKSHGLEYVKPKYLEMKDKYSAIEKTHGELVSGLQELSGFAQKGDFKSFFQALNIPKEKLYQYISDELSFEELPQDQRQQIEGQRQLEQRAMMLEKQNQQYVQQFQDSQVSAKAEQLDGILGVDSIKSVVDSFDARMGTPGAFRNEVIRRGLLAYHQSGQDISPQQAISEVLQLVGMPTQQQQVAPPQATLPQGPPPVIPHVAGRSSSPTKKVARSTQDLRRIYNEL